MEKLCFKIFQILIVSSTFASKLIWFNVCKYVQIKNSIFKAKHQIRISHFDSLYYSLIHHFLAHMYFAINYFECLAGLSSAQQYWAMMSSTKKYRGEVLYFSWVTDPVVLNFVGKVIYFLNGLVYNHFFRFFGLCWPSSIIKKIKGR